MSKTRLRFFYAAVAASMLVTGAANAQTAGLLVSKTSDYTVTWPVSPFNGASAVYAGSLAYAAAPSPGGDQAPSSFDFFPLSNAADLVFVELGGISINPLGSQTPPYPSDITLSTTSNGSAGSWGWTYTTAATRRDPC